MPNPSALGDEAASDFPDGYRRSPTVQALAGGVAAGACTAPKAGDDRALVTLRLMLCDDVALESRDDAHVVVVNTASATRMRLTQATFRFLKAFSSPHRLDEIVPASSLASVLPHVRMLLDKRMLVDADAPTSRTEPLRSAVAYRFCNAPAQEDRTASDFLVLGLPYDLAGDMDSRLAPGLIRQKSLDYSYQLNIDEGRPRGWFDANAAAWILKGATIADAGDVRLDHGESRARYTDRVRAALTQCCAGRTVPVILGGDRSVTAAVVGRPCRAGPLTVVQLTGNPHRATAEGAGEHLLHLSGIEQVLNLDVMRNAPDATGRSVRTWGDALSIHLSIDLGMFAEAESSSMGNVVTPSLSALKAAIAVIGRVHRIAGIDVVGLDMQSRSPELIAVIGCHLALAAMSAAHDGH